MIEGNPRYLFMVHTGTGTAHLGYFSQEVYEGKTYQYFSFNGKRYRVEDFERTHIFCEPMPATPALINALKYFEAEAGSFIPAHPATEHTATISKALERHGT